MKISKTQQAVFDAISKGGNLEIIRRRPRAYGLTTDQVIEFNRRTAEDERILWLAPTWVAMDKKTYDNLVSRANKTDLKIIVDEAS